jgi:hypothetical protein
MADISIKVLQPAESYALLTMEELKVILNLPLTDVSEDPQLQMWIDQYSDVIATMCNRVFAYEKVEETWRGDLPPLDGPRLFLTHYPVADADIPAVESPRGSALDPASYELENASGKLRINGAWAEPVTVTYSGGYDLPEEAPPALKAATGLLIQAARLQARMNATSGVRSIAHRESRVQFFDPLQVLGGKASAVAPLQAATDTVNAMLYKYMRFYV